MTSSVVALSAAKAMDAVLAPANRALSRASPVKASMIAVNSLWPVTLIESQATAGLGLGKPEDWRRADIMADAALAIVRTDPAERTGQALLDEDVLRAAGVTDFDHYACVQGATPKRIPW